jgi:spore photoproduct lyase
MSRPAPLFTPDRIILAKGSASTAARRNLAQAICAAYPDAEVVEATETPHNRIDLGRPGMLDRHQRGKQTLVLAEHQSAVRFSDEAGNGCPNYWHFSPYGFCPYGCHYCYLAGTSGVRFSPTVKIFLNLPEILAEIDATAHRLGRPTAFYLGKLQDGLALDPLTGYTRTMFPFFARHRLARLTLLTKSAGVSDLCDLEHGGNCILSWSINPPEVVRKFEQNTPVVEDRIAAMIQCSRAQYPVRAVLMPIIPVPDWQDIYRRFLHDLLRRVTLSRITLGCICSYPQALWLTERKLGPDNAISAAVARSCDKDGDGRIRFPVPLREEVYRTLVATIREAAPGLEIGLCLEEPHIYKATGLEGSRGRCNCVL